MREYTLREQIDDYLALELYDYGLTLNSNELYCLTDGIIELIKERIENA